MRIKIFFAIVIVSLVLIISAVRRDCWHIHVPARAIIYTESNSATNIVSNVQAGDVIYICGDKNDN